MSFRLEHSTTKMGIRRQILWFYQPVLYSMRREVFGTSAHRKTMKPIIDTNLAAGHPSLDTHRRSRRKWTRTEVASS